MDYKPWKDLTERVKPEPAKDMWRSRAEDLERKVKTLEEERKWHPAETAPKDGQMILACLPRIKNLVLLTRYDKAYECWRHEYESGEEKVIDLFRLHEEDFWMPLPDPPTLPTADGGDR